MALEYSRHLVTLQEYLRMIDAGVFEEDARLELIRGEIVEMTPINDDHAFCVAHLTRILSKLTSSGALVWVQNPIRIGSDSRPEPDIALLELRPDLSRKSPPTAADVILLVEVADTSLTYDRGRKRRLYAGAGISEYWIVNLRNRVIEVYSEPSGDTYKQVRKAQRGETLPLPGGLEGAVAVNDILDE